MTNLLIAVGVVYVLGVVLVFIAGLILWALEKMDGTGSDDAKAYARTALRAPIWPLLLAKLVGRMVEDAGGSDD